MIVVALGGVIGIVFPAMQRVFCCARAQAAPLPIHNGDTHAEGAEIYARYDGHEMFLNWDCIRGNRIAFYAWAYMSHPR